MYAQSDHHTTSPFSRICLSQLHTTLKKIPWRREEENGWPRARGWQQLSSSAGPQSPSFLDTITGRKGKDNLHRTQPKKLLAEKKNKAEGITNTHPPAEIGQVQGYRIGSSFARALCQVDRQEGASVLVVIFGRVLEYSVYKRSWRTHLKCRSPTP